MVKINSAISETIIPVTDATTDTSDIAEGDDAAQIRSKIYSKDYTADLQDDDENNFEIEMSSTYLHNPPKMIHQNNIEAIDYVQAIADAFGVELPQKKNQNHLWKSRGEQIALNEFEEAMHKLLCCAFPEVFMLGGKDITQEPHFLRQNRSDISCFSLLLKQQHLENYYFFSMILNQDTL
jgi:hypothetical protein